MSIRNYLLMTTLLVFMLTSCTATPTPTTVAPAREIPAPSQGNANVVGRVLSASEGKPFPGDYVFLAAVNYNDQGDGAYFLDTGSSPTTQMDENGYFQLTNVPPHDYVLIIGEPSANSTILKEGDRPKILTLQADQVLDLGELRVTLGQ